MGGRGSQQASPEPSSVPVYKKYQRELKRYTAEHDGTFQIQIVSKLVKGFLAGRFDISGIDLGGDTE
jgi:hypothetical protein